MSDKSNLEERLFRLMKEYEQPIPVYKPERVEPYAQHYTPVRYGQTITERVSKNIGNIIGGVAAAVVAITITGIIFVGFLSEINQKRMKSSETIVDRGSSYIIYLEPNIFPGPMGGVYISDADGSNMRLLVEEKGTYDLEQPVLSPDEERVVLVEATRVINPQCELFVVNTDGSRLSQLTLREGLVAKCDHDPFWVDNDTIGFLRSNDEDLYLQINIDENNVGYNLRSYEPIE